MACLETCRAAAGVEREGDGGAVAEGARGDRAHRGPAGLSELHAAAPFHERDARQPPLRYFWRAPNYSFAPFIKIS